MNSIKKMTRYFVKYSGFTVAQLMQYRLNFIMSISIALLGSAVGPIVQLLIFTNTRGYPGWTLEQIILFQGVLLLTSGLSNTLFGNVKPQMYGLVRQGKLDMLLLKPIPTIGTIIGGGFNLEFTGSLFAGLGVIIWSSIKLAIKPDLPMMLGFIIALIAGIIIHMAINIFFCAISVRVVFTGRLGQMFDALMDFSNYPLEIFPRSLQLVFLFIIPFAVMVYLPTKILLENIGWNLAVMVGVSIVFLLFSLLFWNRSVKKYASAGG